MAPLLDLRSNRLGAGPAAVSMVLEGSINMSMDRREQITQMLRDRIARFKRENAYIWERPSKLDNTTVKREDKPKTSIADALKKELGF